MSSYRALLEYIREAKECGAAEAEITAELTNAGWYAVDIRDALHLSHQLAEKELRPVVQKELKLEKPTLAKRLGLRQYDSHLVAIAAAAFAVGFIGYLLITSH